MTQNSKATKTVNHFDPSDILGRLLDTSGGQSPGYWMNIWSKSSFIEPINPEHDRKSGWWILRNYFLMAEEVLKENN